MNRTEPADATEVLRARIRADNYHDVRLYERAVDLWQGRHPGSL